MGHSHAGCHLRHDIASGGGGELPMGGYSECAEPTGGTDPGVILPTLLRSRSKVSVLRHPSPGSRPDIGLMDTSNSELRGHGLFHQDHRQHLCGRSNLPKLPATWDASTRGYGHTTGSHYRKLVGNCWCQYRQQAMESAEDTHHSWHLPDEAQSATTTGVHP